MTSKSVSKICSVEGCGSNHKVVRKMCWKHYQRFRRNGDPLISKSPTWGVDMSKDHCSVADCTGSIFVKISRLCFTHYRRMNSYGTTDPMRVEGVGDTQEAKFWSRVSKADGQGPNGDCWEWQGSRHPQNGYGNVSLYGRRYGAHVAAWALTNNRFPTLFILHSCDNPPCCNPNHLREGTHQDNVDDMMKRGRHWTMRTGGQWQWLP